MEQKFRAVLQASACRCWASTVKATPQTTGERWDITAGGGRDWTLEPQVLVAGSKPDFLLRCDDPNVRRVAIFCDGALYHASPQHNRLADDARKRRSAARAGHVRARLHVGRPRRGTVRPIRRGWIDDRGSASDDPARHRSTARAHRAHARGPDGPARVVDSVARSARP